MPDPSGEPNHAPSEVDEPEVDEPEFDDYEDDVYEDDEDEEGQSIEFEYSATITPGATEMAELLERGSSGAQTTHLRSINPNEASGHFGIFPEPCGSGK
ncbi:MAG: hypothetical protein NTX58_05365 [Actinobacteria bacterium]|nr:hypothetical protein [Actinomycetota bacterium]